MYSSASDRRATKAHQSTPRRRNGEAGKDATRSQALNRNQACESAVYSSASDRRATKAYQSTPRRRNGEAGEDAALSQAWWRPQRDSNPYGSWLKCNGIKWLPTKQGSKIRPTSAPRGPMRWIFPHGPLCRSESHCRSLPKRRLFFLSSGPELRHLVSGLIGSTADWVHKRLTVFGHVLVVRRCEHHVGGGIREGNTDFCHRGG